ncbi:MAG: biotin/lipoyl-binding protein [Clostridiales bacterium]|jgi:biotin carboxyl carrier protein|nr:biotin/lipoyl-binding protein [Clostridiales bacterium]
MKKFTVKVNGKSYEVEIEELEKSSSKEQASTKQKNIVIENEVNESQNTFLHDPKNQENTTSEKSIKVIAPMPGNIISVNVKNGVSINSGDVICVLESMKMENEICAPKSGKIVTINISNGDSVKTGDILVVIE